MTTTSHARETAVAGSLAQHTAIERLLNAFLRESGLDRPDLHDPGLPLTLPCEGSGRRPMRIAFPAASATLLGTLTYLSCCGHHRYGQQFWVTDTASPSPRPLRGAAEAAELVVTQIGAGETDPRRRVRLQRALVEQVANSVTKTTRYLEQRLARPEAPSCLEDSSPLLASEQSLCFGHPFHPTPKSSEGFTQADLERYAPELQASFPLHWFAVSPHLVTEEGIEGGGEAWAAVEQAARRALRGRFADRVLLPTHPWQDRHLCSQPAVQALLAAGRIVPLGPLGPPVRPTSSVRTVWDPASGLFVKLPLAVRITNFVRINPREQLRRSIDAARVVAAVAPWLDLGGMRVLLERATRALAPPDDVEDVVWGQTGVLVRDGPPSRGTSAPIVVAALLEEDPRHGLPPLVRTVQRAAQTAGDTLTPAFVRRWLTRYLTRVLTPLLRLLIEGGIGLEAHAQNTLVAFEDGWPARCYARDLEGTSCNRAHPLARRGFLVGLSPDSPALYPEEEVWQRFSYYVVINHLGQLIATLARHLDLDEESLWATARSLTAHEAHRHRGHPAAGPLRHLLDDPHLPAKANLRSRFGERGERPLYIRVSNPLVTATRPRR